MLARSCIALLLLFAAVGCGEKRRPATANDAKPAPGQTAPAQAEPATDAPSSAEIVQDYTKNLSTAPARAAATVDLASIQKAVSAFEAMEGRLPKSLEELVAMRYLPQLPPVPQGKRLSYDPATGKVTLVAQ